MFASRANNYFGQRCYRKGCGLIPAKRARNAKFEVRHFDSVPRSVASYVFNINYHREYAGLREYRAAQRQAGEPLDSIEAAERMAFHQRSCGTPVQIKVADVEGRTGPLKVFGAA